MRQEQNEALRKKFRTKMVRQPTTASRNTYSDGFQQALVWAIRELDLAALSQPVATPTPSQEAAVVDAARNVFAGSDDDDTELMAAAREAGWALMEIVDGIDWTKRNQVAAIITRLGKALAATRPAEAQAVAEVEVSPTSVLSITSAALSESNNVLMAVHEWQAGSEVLPLDLWARVRDVLRKAGRI